jgi:hypothetical protein
MPWVWDPVMVVPMPLKLSTIEEWWQEQSCLFWWGEYMNKSHDLNKLFWVHFPAKIFSVAQNLSPTEEHHISSSRLKEQGPQLWKSVQCLMPSGDDFYSIKTKQDRRMVQRTKLFVSARILQKLRSQIQTLPWVWVLVNLLDLGLFFYVIQWYILKDQAYDMLLGNKDWYEM